MDFGRVRLANTARNIPTTATNIRPSAPDELATVSVILRHRTPAPASLETQNTPLTLKDFAAHYGADPGDIDKVRKFAIGHGLTVSEVNPARSTITLSGSLNSLDRAFGVNLKSFEMAGTKHRA